MRYLTLFLTTALVVGCATAPSQSPYRHSSPSGITGGATESIRTPTPTPDPAATQKSTSTEAKASSQIADTSGPRATCVSVPAHTTATGTSVAASYRCEGGTSFPPSLSSVCTYVGAYMRSDGAAVSAHLRCTRDVASILSTPYTAPAPSYRSYSGGPVRVSGYRRKDGTYVRPHTRRRPSR